MFNFEKSGKTSAKKSDKFVARLVVIGGRSDAELAVRMTLDNSGQLEESVEVMENGSAGDNTLLNVGALFEDALQDVKEGYDFGLLDNGRVEVFMPGLVADFINNKYYLELLENLQDPRPKQKKRNICDMEVQMWKSISEILVALGNHVVVRDISKIKIDNYYRKYATAKEKVLDEMQAKVWDSIPDPNNRTGQRGGALEEAIG